MNYVLGLVFSKDLSQVLLIVKNRPEWMKGLANGIGGKIEPNESIIDAMIREAYEEADLEDLTWTPYMTMTGHTDDDFWRVTCFASRVDDINKHVAKTDEDLVVWDARRLPTNIVPHLEMNVQMALLAFSSPFHADVVFV